MTLIEKCARLLGLDYEKIGGDIFVPETIPGLPSHRIFDPINNKADLVDVECELWIDVEWDDAASDPNVKCTRRIGSKFAYSKVWLSNHPDKFTARAHAVMAVVEQIYDAKFGGQP